LGAYVQELTPKLAAGFGVKATKGAIVADLLPDGPAAKAGLKKDDVIVSMNGKDVDGRSLRLAVGSMAPGSTINLKVLRDGSEHNFSVTLDTMPPDTQRTDQDQDDPFAAPRRGRRG
jgi:serine protease Do